MTDITKAINKLVLAIRTIEYKVQTNLVAAGSTDEFLRLYRYLFVDYSVLLADEIHRNYQMDLKKMKDDKQFIDSVYKVAEIMFNYRPELSRKNYFDKNAANMNNAQAKVLMAVDIIQYIDRVVKSLKLTSSLSEAASSVSRVNGGMETGANAPKLTTQGLKSTQSQLNLNGQAPSVRPLTRSTSINYGTNRGLALKSSIPTRSLAQLPAQELKAVRFKFSNFSNQMNLTPDQILDDQDCESSRPDSYEGLRDMIESLNKRVAHLENQNEHMATQLVQQQKIIENLQMTPCNQGSRSSTNRGGNRSLFDQDNSDDESNTTAYQTMVESFSPDKLHVQSIESTTTPTHQASALLAQMDAVDDLSLDPNDVTPKMDRMSAVNPNQFENVCSGTYLVDRTKQLMNRRLPSQLNEEPRNQAKK